MASAGSPCENAQAFGANSTIVLPTPAFARKASGSKSPFNLLRLIAVPATELLLIRGILEVGGRAFAAIGIVLMVVFSNT
jgi:hypothetical protein